MYYLFVDDERDPSKLVLGSSLSVIARTYDDAVRVMTAMGCPEEVSLDHDLGPDQKTGYDIVKWMVDEDMNQEGQFFHPRFKFYVHSANPVGANNMINLYNNYIEKRFAIHDQTVVV